jgi:methionyl-tRNA synthetase
MRLQASGSLLRGQINISTKTTPWVLAKDEAQKPRLNQVLYNLCEGIRLIAAYIEPFMPETAEKNTQANRNIRYRQGWNDKGKFTVQKGEPLFPRIDLEKELSELENITV